MAYSVLFIQHFQAPCYSADSMLSQSLYLEEKRACLKPEALPTYIC